MKTSKVDDGFTPSFLHWKVKISPNSFLAFGSARLANRASAPLIGFLDYEKNWGRDAVAWYESPGL